MSKGNIRNNYVIICDECWGVIEIAVSLAELNKAVKDNPSFKYDMPDFLQGLAGMFDGKKT